MFSKKLIMDKLNAINSNNNAKLIKKLFKLIVSADIYQHLSEPVLVRHS